MIEMSVEDEGEGIAVDLRERVFDKFFRAANGSLGENASGFDHPQGLGMGLAIARGIIEAHGGRIRIEGGEGDHGTCVKLWIPIGDEEPAAGEIGSNNDE